MSKIMKKGSLKNLILLNALGRDYDLDDRYVGDCFGNVYRYKEVDKDNYEVTPNSPFKNKDGYTEFVLTNKNGVKKHIMGQIICAGLWLTKPKGKDYVNHKDGVRSNNYYKNLAWSTQGENLRHSYRVLGRKPTTGKRK